MRGAALPALLLLVLLPSCATGGRLRATAEGVRGEAEKARAAGAPECAPRELAAADANVELALLELDLGRSGRAEEHLDLAARAAREAAELTRDCQRARRPIIVKVDTDGDGVPDDEDRCPDVPGPRESFGCPKDTDGDGIPDDIDRCPLDPEDRDGFQDEDGCPDPDNDQDGIVDALDACPNNPGPLENRGCPVGDRDGDGVPDHLDKCPDERGPPPDGCPRKYTLVEVKRERIATRRQVGYAAGKHRILKASHSVLDQVAQALKDDPTLRIRIEGHTDEAGGAAANLKLSERRAAAVRAYLLGRGVEAGRVEAVGYGAARPVASSKTARGRLQNRRTEFRILAAGE